VAWVIGEENYAGCEKGGSSRLNKTAEARKLSLGSAHPKSGKFFEVYIIPLSDTENKEQTQPPQKP
jgi:hypothetical protein